MLRHFFVLVSVLPFMFLFNSGEIKKEELKVELVVPNSADPGTEFTVKLKLTGGDVKGFAKYTDKLPEGFTAMAGEMGDATFTADNGQIKIIWLEFPKEDEVIVEYKMKVAESVSGNIQMGGKFSYLDNNEKRIFSVFKKSIAIGSQAIAAKEEVKEEVQAEVSVNISRRVVSSKENVHKIEITVSQTGIQDFGKIQEYVPMGAKIEEGETENAAFSSIKNKVKFVWMSIPKKETFVVSYFVDLSDADSKDIKSITGAFAYLDNNSASKKVEINFGAAEPMLASNTSESSESSSENSEDNEQPPAETENKTQESTSTASSTKPEEKIAVVTPAVAAGAVTATAVASNKTQNEEVVEEASTEPEPENENLDDVFGDTPADEVAVVEEVKEEVEEEVIPEDNSSNEENEVATQENVVEENIVEEIPIEEEKEEPVTAKASPKVKPAAKTYNSPVANGVKYRVQIAAGANVVDAAYFKQRHKFETAFNIENHQGWVKYTTGSYSMYKDARDSREDINSAGHEFDGPFVTAYNDGNRITVQEALMISTQKWYK